MALAFVGGCSMSFGAEVFLSSSLAGTSQQVAGLDNVKSLLWGWIKRLSMMGLFWGSSDGLTGICLGKEALGKEVIALFFSWGWQDHGSRLTRA